MCLFSLFPELAGHRRAEERQQVLGRGRLCRQDASHSLPPDFPGRTPRGLSPEAQVSIATSVWSPAQKDMRSRPTGPCPSPPLAPTFSGCRAGSHPRRTCEVQLQLQQMISLLCTHQRVTMSKLCPLFKKSWSTCPEQCRRLDGSHSPSPQLCLVHVYPCLSCGPFAET